MKRKTVSLRTQLFVLMALLVFLQSLSLVLALAISDVYSKLDAESFRLLSSNTNARMHTLNQSVGELTANVTTETQRLSLDLQRIAAGQQSMSALHTIDHLYDEAAMAAAESLMNVLRTNSVTGAYLLLGGSNAHKEAASAHSAVYIRNSAPSHAAGDASQYLLEIGPIKVAQQYQIPTSVNWDLDLTFLRGSGSLYSFYDQPISASSTLPGAELERYGYWSSPVAILRDNQPVITYSLPLLDADGVAFGIVGIEISLAHFTQNYLPNIDLPYTNSFYAIASVQNDALDLSWYIPSGPLAQAYLRQNGHYPLQKTSAADVYGTYVDGIGEMYCSLQPLDMYSRNSPFYSDTWTLVGFVPRQAVHETSTGVRTLLSGSIIVTTLISFAAIFLLVWFATRKISGLSKYIRGLDPYHPVHFKRTGMREIDELTTALETLNESVLNASKTTAKILELTLLPLGGFEISGKTDYVVLTEYVYKLLDIEPGTLVSKGEWARHFRSLTAHPAKEQENVYRYPFEDFVDSKWLRILQAPTDEGQVGVILDVSKEMEERLRLARELDHDRLTHLLNRTAFKREAHQKIMQAPDKVGVMLFSDLDNLKYINDTFGHDMGDRLLISAGEMFRAFARPDFPAARISGDEFSVYLHGFATKAEARAVIDRCIEESRGYTLRTPDGTDQRIRFSTGIAWYPDDSDNVTDLLKLSDFAMYEAKHSRKGSMFEFSRESYRANAFILENREAINRLLDDGLIRFAFQPIISLHTGEVYAYEALMRPLLDNFRSPYEILAVAAAQSKLSQLERLVMLTAFQTVSEHIGALGDIKIFINSIPSEIAAEEDLLFISRCYPHLFSNIVIEITEAESDSPEKFQRKLGFIKEHGMQLAIDDFGSGYSNELRILSMNPDIIKVDMALIQGIHENQDQQQLVANLISFCHPRGIRLIAEGVETSEDLAAIIRLGVDYVQGYYTGRPAFEFVPVDPAIQQEILRYRAEADAAGGTP